MPARFAVKPYANSVSPQLLLIAPGNAQALGLDTGEERNPWVERAKGEATASQVRKSDVDDAPNHANMPIF